MSRLWRDSPGYPYDRKVAVLITVVILDTGDVQYRCGKCGLDTVVKIHDTQSVFWDMHNGLAVLAMLGHYQASHKNERM